MQQSLSTAKPLRNQKLTTELVEDDEVEAIVQCMRRNQSDLLVLGLHRHSLLLSRMWNHTTYDLVQQHSRGFIENWQQQHLHWLAYA
jgi:hypothetical protein